MAKKKCVKGHICDKSSASRYSRILRQQYDEKLAELRKQPLVDWQIIPCGEEVAWMSEDERNIVEWFDRKEYEIFLDRARFYRKKRSWIIAFCRYVSIIEIGRIDPNWWKMLDPVIDVIVAAAESGNARAQYSLGYLHERGYNGRTRQLPWDVDIAWDWYKKSAEAGSVLGQRAFIRFLQGGKSWKQLYGLSKEEIVAGKGRDSLDWEVMKEQCLQSCRDCLKESLKWCEIIAKRGDVRMCYDLACQYISGDDEIRDIVHGVKWLRTAARLGFPEAVAVMSTAGEDTSDARLAAELHISILIQKRKSRWNTYGENVLQFEISEDPKDGLFGDAWLLSDKPIGTIVPPPSGRGGMRTPKLQSANPSFAARLLALVRDKFSGDAPKVYRAAHINRKTYSSIISNELRPVSKQTAIAFSLALHLSDAEMADLLRSAGYALSEFLLEDIIVQACSRSEIFDIQKVNEILLAHSAKPLPL